ncbi:hypothetical protein AGRA3207_003976 [Actinomadura graeca]|uniref:Uncharacterized protein n=1 Tax=Actinomadura graeca TaxID=2750812 RepID=A0ABX8R1L6_9ACTN|nr:hypothetical protein [Actinomadura graeca]QXJ22898.1 hypothetical protein AGRA3207_003976 [Actinomadura graeca]
MISNRRKPSEEVGTRFGRAQEAARHGARLARQRASSAAERIGPATAQRVLVARGWGAPRLRRAAGYVETSLAPRVSGFLSDVAHRVEPPRKERPRRGAVMAMVGAVAAVGVAGAVVTRRGTVAGSGDPDQATSADSMTVSGSDADGQVHSPN